MFWKFDEEENKVVPRKPVDIGLSPEEFLEKAKETGHSSFIHGLDEEDQEVVFELLQEKQKEEFGSSDETGAEERFEKRKEVFKQQEEPIYKHHVWWLIHNCVAHPLIGIFPCKWTFDFHDWTSIKINGK